MTSNQLWMHAQMCHPDNERLFLNAVREYKGQGWLAIYTRIVSPAVTRSMTGSHGARQLADHWFQPDRLV